MKYTDSRKAHGALMEMRARDHMRKAMGQVRTAVGGPVGAFAHGQGSDPDMSCKACGHMVCSCIRLPDGWRQFGNALDPQAAKRMGTNVWVFRVSENGRYDGPNPRWCWGIICGSVQERGFLTRLDAIAAVERSMRGQQ